MNEDVYLTPTTMAIVRIFEGWAVICLAILAGALVTWGYYRQQDDTHSWTGHSKI